MLGEAKMASRLVGCLFLAAALGSCAAQNNKWVAAPGTNVAEFEPTRAKCDYIARHGGEGFVAAGNANFVAGAAVGHGISNAVRAQQDFNDCMIVNGWRVAPEQ